MCVCVYMCVCVCVCVYAHMHVHTLTNSYIHSGILCNHSKDVLICVTTWNNLKA